MKSITFLIKPASSLCNLRCRYCFYEDEAENRSMPSMGIMNQETAELLINEAYQEAGSKLISFAFQGGEPTVCGLDFFKHFTAYARANKPQNVQLAFSIQTNGTLLDDEWADFFHKEEFLVGLSIDGHKDLHNRHRVDPSGKDTWNKVIRAAELLKKHRVETNALCVVTGPLSRSAAKVYQNLKKLGFRYQQYIACLDPIGVPRGSMPWSLTPKAYGEFLCQLFDLWYRDWENGDYHSIRLFEDYIHIMLGDEGSTCATCGKCGSYFVAEGDGSLYPCDFFVLDDWKMGMLGEASLSELQNGEVCQRFLSFGTQKPAECQTCPYRQLCNGGCKNDWITEDGRPFTWKDALSTDKCASAPRNYFCESFRMLFDYAKDRMNIIAREEYRARSQYR